MSEPEVSPVAETGRQEPHAARPGAAAASPQLPGLSPGLVRLMAVTCAVTVANLYYAQPLLQSIDRKSVV